MQIASRQFPRPLRRHLLWLVLASAVPAAWAAAALAATVARPSAASALALLTGAVALAAGAYASLLLARGLRNSLDDLAADARMLNSGSPLARLGTNVRELAAIAEALAAASVPVEAPLAPRFDLASGAARWSRAVEDLYRGAGGSAPSVSAAAPWCEPAAVLASLARDFAPRARVVGVVLDIDVASGLGAARGSARDLAAALAELLEAALLVTVRGAAVSLRASAAPMGGVKLVLGNGGGTGIGGMVELRSGAQLAASLSRARVLIEAAGGTLVSGAGTVTILLASPAAAPLAA
jgi:hypothetical protein